MKISGWLLLTFLLPLGLQAQDEVLLTIDGHPVMRSEFERIYHKNNHVTGYESKTVTEYLELFVNFKLKVYEAQQLGYDTTKAFVKELAGYREQLEKPYLQERRVIDSLVQVAYFRTLNEVNASHIMIRLAPNSVPADTLKAYNRIMDIRKRIMGGESFQKVAQEASEDPSAKNNGGNLGWFSAFSMVFSFEDAAYRMDVGEISMPVRSKYGYHLIQVNGKRPALGEIKLAHIMTRADRNEGEEKLAKARENIFNYFEMLKSGNTFVNVARQYSEDAGTAKKGGQMRWLRSGELPLTIEEKVYALKDSGDITDPLQSDYGWHIFELQGKRPIASFNELKAQLEDKIMSDERGKIAEQTLLARIKAEAGFITYPENTEALAAMVDSGLYTGKWDPRSAGELIEPVFTISDREYTQGDLAAFIVARQYRKNEGLADIVTKRCTEYANQELIAWEKGRLEEKYPDFRNLMQEYHDGILLFNITDQMVWNKAVADTAGLLGFYEINKGNYTWKERADISVYTLKDASLLEVTKKMAHKRATRKWPAEEFNKMICPGDSIPCVTFVDGKYEKGDESVTGAFTWKKGFEVTREEMDSWKLLVVNAIVPPTTKTLDEVRGQVTADYQNFLDLQWIASLRAKYPVVVNQEVLNRIN